MLKGRDPAWLYLGYALEGYELNIVDYLLKPFSFERFLKAINKLSNNTNPIEESLPNTNYKPAINANENKFIFVKSDYENLKINVHEIKFIEGLKDYLKINLSNDKFVLTLSNFATLLDKISNDDFIRVHNSYVVNLNFIKSIQKNRIIIGDKRIPISETYKKDFFEKIKLQ